MKNTIAALAVLVLASPTARAWPDRKVTRREYKTMLHASLFNGDSEQVKQTLLDLEVDLSAIASMVGAKFSRPSSFVLKRGMPRTVQFYDTPGTCLLNSNSWSFRVRQETTTTTRPVPDDDEDAEGTLKFRSGDRYYSTFRAKSMNDCSNGFSKGQNEGKMEEDINLEWYSSFSYSHKCRLPHSKTINTLHDVSDVWYEMESVMEEEMGWNLDTPLQLVSNLTVTENVYKGYTVDFDNGDEDEVGVFAVTLWYLVSEDDGDEEEEEEGPMTPTLAEVSFTTEDKDENWNDATIQKTHAFWNQVKESLQEWINPASSTKTRWVYEYASFCNEHDDSFDDGLS